MLIGNQTFYESIHYFHKEFRVLFWCVFFSNWKAIISKRIYFVILVTFCKKIALNFILIMFWRNSLSYRRQYLRVVEVNVACFLFLQFYKTFAPIRLYQNLLFELTFAFRHYCLKKFQKNETQSCLWIKSIS